MKLIYTLVTAAALATANSAQAVDVVTDWDVHDTVETGVVQHDEGGLFTDYFTFSLSPSSLLSTSVSNNILDILHISDGHVDLYMGDYADGTGDDTWEGGYDFDGTTGNSPNLFDSLAAGSYYYRVTGDSDGSYSGLYTISSALKAPIPEPETYAMLLIGLGATLIARRSKKA